MQLFPRTDSATTPLPDTTDPLFLTHVKTERAAALVVVLVILVLLLGTILAFFAQSVVQKQISRHSAENTSAELLATGASQTIIGDLLQEISDGSEPISYNQNLYHPLSTKYFIPAIALKGPSQPNDLIGNGLENLIKTSSYAVKFSDKGIARAAHASTSDSQESRPLSMQRWKMPMLIPSSATGFVSPDWVLTSRDGSNPTEWSNTLKWLPIGSKGANEKSVIGRFSYVIYNEGGLLDANVAGYPSDAKKPLTGEVEIKDQTIYKTASAYADLIKIGLTSEQIEKLVAWRNNATLSGPHGSLQNNYFSYVSTNNSNFMEVGSSSTDGACDKRFISRQQLIDFFQNQLGGRGDAATQDSLAYLGTFSRCRNYPTYWPDANLPKVSGGSQGQMFRYPYTGENSAVGKDIDAVTGFNPAISKVLVRHQFMRRDGSVAKLGDSLVNRRFPLDILCWLTCEGPSRTASDSVRDEYIKRGVDKTLLDQGSDENILRYFGLSWVGAVGVKGGFWVYCSPDNDGVAAVPSSAKKAANKIKTLGGPSSVTEAARDPDFFEMLKAAIKAGSLGKTMVGGWGPTWNGGPSGDNTWVQQGDTYVDLHIMQLGANIIDQANPTCFPSWIKFSIPNNNTIRNVFGSQDLPYFNSIPHFVLVQPDGKNGLFLAAPSVWNPYEAPKSSFPLLGPSQLKVAAMTGPAVEDNHTQTYTSNIVVYYQGGGATVLTRSWSEALNTMTFSNHASLYREPTLLFQPGIPTGSDLDLSIPGRSGGYKDNDGKSSFLGFLLATIPLYSDGHPVDKAFLSGPSKLTDTDSIRLSYLEGGKWVPYQEINYSENSGIPNQIPTVQASVLNPSQWGPNNAKSWYADSGWDPRTTRFGTFREMKVQPFYNLGSSELQTLWPSGLPVNSGRPLTPDEEQKQRWWAPNGFYFPRTARNITGELTYYADPDGVVRRGTAYRSATLEPLQQPPLSGARPIFLHRPYRSVAELGYVFRDTPWRNIDFSIPESGDSALLDVFCIHDSQNNIAAGKVDLNTRQSKVVQALLSRSYQDESTASNPILMSDSDVEIAASKLVKRTNVDGKPIENIADLVGKWKSGSNSAIPVDGSKSFDGFSQDLTSGGDAQRFREAAMRALSDTGMAGTWNLLIDIIAQTGKYPDNASKLSDFKVGAEKRVWVHVAIDRLTGKIIDQQFEWIKE